MSETSEIIADMASRLFADLSTPEALRDAETGAWNASAWAQMEKSGLPLALVPEAADGVGLSWPEGAGLVRLAGTHGLPLPLLETMLANRLLATAGLTPATGPVTLAPVQAGEGFTLDRDGPGWRLRGRAGRVPWAAHASWIVVLAGFGGRLHAACLDQGSATIRPGANLAGEPRDDISVDTLLAEDAVGSLPADIDATTIRLWGAGLRAASIAGAATRVLDLTVNYANERTQFGRPIGKYQAIQQSLAVMAGQVAACTGAATLAADGLETGDPLSVAIGKARAGEAAGVIAASAHQAHGAIGFTHEHCLHFLTKRLWSWREEFGNEAYWQREIGRRMARAGSKGLWPLIASL